MLYRPQVEFLEGRLAPAVLTVLNTNDSGPGSLRQAILDANSTPGDDTIAFAAGITGTISLASQLPDLSSNIDLEGPGAANLAVQAKSGGFFGVFDVTSGAAVAIAGLTVVDGYADQGGGIRNDGTLTVRACTIANNTAPSEGGGIANHGTLTLRESTVRGNTAPGVVSPPVPPLGFRGFTPGQGGGVYNDGVMTIDRSTVAANSVLGGAGGGIANSGTLTVRDSTVAFNLAQSQVLAGIRENPRGYYAGSGGGLANNGFLTLRNSTVASNSAFGGNGGGIYTSGIGAVNVTIFATLIAQNTLQPEGQTPTSPDVFVPALISLGHNLIGDGTSGGGFVATDHVGTSSHPVIPQLGPLQDNGGPTVTMALLPGSPAVNAGDNTGAPATDQRGLPRIVGGVIDIGAYEYQGPFLSSNELWVTHVYIDLLNRQPDPAGLAFWSGSLAQGASPTTVALAILHSTEYYTDQVQQRYQRLLNRAADPQGLQSAVAFLTRGNSVEQLQTALLASDEYYQDHGGSVAGFVAGVYQDTLGRTASPAEVASWQGILQRGSPRVLAALGIGNSVEADAYVVGNTYQQFLSRQAAPDERTAWVTVLQEGIWQVLMDASFLSSAEYLA